MHALLRGAQSAPRRVVVGADTTAVSAPPKTTQRADPSDWITARDERHCSGPS